ncbi:MAG: PKD domain-containing protein, partial [Saprospiraceae bacterium]|nr:PKD domain-containing protein [Saprospiraceae bacterium]
LISLLQIGFSQTITSLQPTQILGGIGAVLSVRGSDFGDVQADSYVSFLQSDNNYMPSTSASSLHYLSWTDTLITLEMPVAFSGKVKIVRSGVEYWSPENLKVLANLDYRQVNPLDYIYLTDRNDRGGVTWSVHPDYWDNPEARSAIVDVFIEFRCKTGVNYILEPLNMAVPIDLGQGKNIIAPDTSLAGGVVGINDYLWFSCIVGAETFYYRYTQLLRFSTLEDWYFGTGEIPLGKSKFRYALMHELGHAVGLGHVNEHGQSMYPTITLWPSNDWSMRDSITTAEKEAMSYFVQRCQDNTFTACGVKAMLPILDCEDVLANASAMADFTVSANEGCAPLTVQFTNTSSSNATSFDWQFPGGNPSSSTEENPSVQYFTPGVYNVTLVVTSIGGSSSSFTQPGLVTVNGAPSAGYTSSLNGSTVDFTNTSVGATSYIWNFGDQSSSTDENPTHTYASNGVYTVTLTATNNCGSTIFEQTISLSTSTAEATWIKGFKLFPNPNTGVFTIEMNGLPQEELEFTLFNTLGQHIKRETVDFGAGYLLHSFDYRTLPSGSYMLRVQADGQAVFVKVTLSK